MERLLIVNADDFGLSKGQNYGIIEACRNGIVTSTTALVNGQAIDHAVQLSRDEPSLAIGMHFVLTMGKPLTAMPGLTRDGVLGKWIWQLAEEDALPLEEITQELASQYLRFIDLRILIAIIMCICSRRFSRLLPGLRLKRALRCGRIVRWCLICRSTCALPRDSAVHSTVKRSVSRCSCKCLMTPVIAASALWK